MRAWHKIFKTEDNVPVGTRKLLDNFFAFLKVSEERSRRQIRIRQRYRYVRYERINEIGTGSDSLYNPILFFQEEAKEFLTKVSPEDLYNVFRKVRTVLHFYCMPYVSYQRFVKLSKISITKPLSPPTPPKKIHYIFEIQVAECLSGIT